MILSELQEELVDDFAIAITEHCGGQGAGRMACELLDRDATSTLLLLLQRGGGGAVARDHFHCGAGIV